MALILDIKRTRNALIGSKREPFRITQGPGGIKLLNVGAGLPLLYTAVWDWHG